MKFLVVKRFTVEAGAPQEAINRVSSGEGSFLFLSVQKKTEPVSRSDWPLWATGFKLVARPEDRGIGDVIARLIGPENSDSFRKWYKRIFKQDCGCTGRQTRWNALYPLK